MFPKLLVVVAMLVAWKATTLTARENVTFLRTSTIGTPLVVTTITVLPNTLLEQQTLSSCELFLKNDEKRYLQQTCCMKHEDFTLV